jgi:hypothetical protein
MGHPAPRGALNAATLSEKNLSLIETILPKSDTKSAFYDTICTPTESLF